MGSQSFLSDPQDLVGWLAGLRRSGTAPPFQPASLARCPAQLSRRGRYLPLVASSVAVHTVGRCHAERHERPLPPNLTSHLPLSAAQLSWPTMKSCELSRRLSLRGTFGPKGSLLDAPPPRDGRSPSRAHLFQLDKCLDKTALDKVIYQMQSSSDIASRNKAMVPAWQESTPTMWTVLQLTSRRPRRSQLLFWKDAEEYAVRCRGGKRSLRRFTSATSSLAPNMR